MIACSHGGIVEDSFLLPSVCSFTRKLRDAFLATPSTFKVTVRSGHRTIVNGKEVNYHARKTKVWARNVIVLRNNGNFLKGAENENQKKSK
jgi:hypothetical protein